MTRRGAATASLDSAIEGEFPTTAGVIALGNLHAQIDGQVQEAAAGRLTVSAQAGLIELIALRGHVLGCIADYEWAEALAEQLTQDAPSDGDALLARARTRATFHRLLMRLLTSMKPCGLERNARRWTRSVPRSSKRQDNMNRL